MDRIIRETIERAAAFDLTRWLQNWEGAPAQRIDDMVGACGLRVVWRPLGGQQGLIDFEAREIVLNSSLYRIAFDGTDIRGVHFWTIAHEIGHWRLHRWEASRGDAFGWVHEQEAHFYAACLLLPAQLLELEQEFADLQRWQAGGRAVDSRAVNAAVRSLAGRYHVSKSAMGSRLAQLGLCHYRAGRCSLRPRDRITKDLRGPQRATKPQAMGRLMSALEGFQRKAR